MSDISVADDELSAAVTAAEAAIAHAHKVAASSSSAVSAPALTQSLHRLEIATRQLESCSRHVLAEVDRRGVAGEYGANSTSSLLQQLLLISPYEAGARARAAQEFCPRVAMSGEVMEPLFRFAGAALSAGEISLTHAKIIAATRTALPSKVDAVHRDAVEEFLTGQARVLAPKQLANAAERLRDTLNPDGALDEELDRERRRFFTLTDVTGGGSRGSAYFTPEMTMILKPALDALAAPQNVDGMPDTRTPGQRTHDALAEIIMRVLRSGTLPDSGGMPVTVMISTTSEQLAAAEAGEHVLVEDAYGNQVSLSTVLSLGAELQLGSVTLSTTGGILDYGKTRRLASCEQRRALAVRDKGCSFPGCDRPPSWTEIHHIHEWIRGGETKIDNLVMLCRYHHRNFEQAGWIVRMGGAGVPEWTPPKWLDDQQRPRRNTVHDQPRLPELV